MGKQAVMREHRSGARWLDSLLRLLLFYVHELSGIKGIECFFFVEALRIKEEFEKQRKKHELILSLFFFTHCALLVGYCLQHQETVIKVLCQEKEGGSRVLRIAIRLSISCADLNRAELMEQTSSTSIDRFYFLHFRRLHHT